MTRINLNNNNNNRDRRTNPIGNIIHDERGKKNHLECLRSETANKPCLPFAYRRIFDRKNKRITKHIQSINTSLDLHATNTDRHNNNGKREDHIRMLILHWNTVVVCTGVFPPVHVPSLRLQQYIYTYFQLEDTHQATCFVLLDYGCLFIVTEFLGIWCCLISQLINIDLLDFSA